MLTNLRQKVMAGALVILVSACGFAQKNDNKRQPKPSDPPKVVVKPKDEKPPPNNNSNRGRNHD
jgi:hypothetical protein